MGKEIQVEIVGRETIKPSSPTLDHLRKYNLSQIDQFFHGAIGSPLLFYAGNPDTIKANVYEKADKISKLLKSSLSKTLTRFYPFAGRVRDRISIECNDDGVPFIETQVNRPLSGILQKPDAEFLEKLLPTDDETSREAIPSPLLQVQVNFFECGGIVIGLKSSHELTDAHSLALFLKAWSATTLNPDDTMTFADFNMASLVPAIDPANISNTFQLRGGDCLTRRYVFDASKIALLKAQATNEGVKQPTRVECVNGLIWKCMAVASISKIGYPRPSLFEQTVNLRKRFVPRLPENSIGSIVLPSIVAIQETNNIELQGLIESMRRGVQDISKIDGGEMVQFLSKMTKEMEILSQKDDVDVYRSSSWCRFPFYEADFGWGKPIWITPNLKMLKNFLYLVDARDGQGIEAWCCFLAEDVALLERDEEFLAFASINPSVV